MNEKEIILRTYSGVWKIDRKLYSLEGYKLPFPVSIVDAAYFAVSLSFLIFIYKIIPFLNGINFIIRFIAAPFALTKLLTTIKLDGKYPHKFFIDYIQFFIAPKVYSRFVPVVRYDKKIKFYDKITYNHYTSIDKTELLMSKNKLKKGEGYV